MLPSTKIILCFLFVACQKEQLPAPQHLEIEMLAAVNSLRQTGCLCGNTYMPPAPPLIWNDTLALAAASHVTDMYTHNYFAHIAPDGSSPIQRAIQAGYTGNYVGENIAMAYYTIPAVMEAWKQSEEHCKAMMDTLYKEMGAAETHGYWTQEFGRNE